MFGSVETGLPSSGGRTDPDQMRTTIDRILDHCDGLDPGGVVGIYLYGSSTTGGLRNDSDIDLLLITHRSLTAHERRQLTELLLRYSGQRATVEAGRPIELTSVVYPSLAPWTYPPTCDYQYGEWLRDDFSDGTVPQRHTEPDLTILLASARPSSEPLRGPCLDELIEAVPAADIRRAIHDSLPGLLDDVNGDVRNVLLTLARMIVTLESDEIVPKDQAVRRISDRVALEDTRLLDLARRGYLGETVDDWTLLSAQARTTAEHLAARVRELSTDANPSGPPGRSQPL
jgi:aminoglycoside 9-adenylyltransferase